MERNKIVIGLGILVILGLLFFVTSKQGQLSLASIVCTEWEYSDCVESTTEFETCWDEDVVTQEICELEFTRKIGGTPGTTTTETQPIACQAGNKGQCEIKFGVDALASAQVQAQIGYDIYKVKTDGTHFKIATKSFTKLAGRSNANGDWITLLNGESSYFKLASCSTNIATCYFASGRLMPFYTLETFNNVCTTTTGVVKTNPHECNGKEVCLKREKLTTANKQFLDATVQESSSLPDALQIKDVRCINSFESCGNNVCESQYDENKDSCAIDCDTQETCKQRADADWAVTHPGVVAESSLCLTVLLDNVKCKYDVTESTTPDCKCASLASHLPDDTECIDYNFEYITSTNTCKIAKQLQDDAPDGCFNIEDDSSDKPSLDRFTSDDCGAAGQELCPGVGCDFGHVKDENINRCIKLQEKPGIGQGALGDVSQFVAENSRMILVIIIMVVMGITLALVFRR